MTYSFRNKISEDLWHISKYLLSKYRQISFGVTQKLEMDHFPTALIVLIEKFKKVGWRHYTRLEVKLGDWLDISN